MEATLTKFTPNYCDNIGDNTAEIYLYDNIGAGGIDAGEFVKELQFLDALGLSEIKVRINSNGGSVIDGFGIFSAIQNAKTPVNTYIDGIAASIAGIIALAGKKRYMVDFGRLMIHDPHFNKAPQDVTDKESEVLAQIKDSLVKIFTNNTTKEAGEIAAIMANESWYNAEDAKKEGFIDEVLQTARIKELAAASIDHIFNSVTINNETKTETKPIKNTMENLKNHFELKAEATETDILAKIETLETELTSNRDQVETLTQEKTNLETEKEALVTAVDNYETSIALLTVETAIKEGKISGDNMDELVNNAKKDLDGFKAIINSVTAAPVSITETITNNETSDGRNDWTIRDWEQKDPSGLYEMLKTDREAYNKLYNDFYKTKK